MPDRTTTVEHEILALDDIWAEARVRRNMEAYDRLTADTFLGVSANGGVVTKGERLREFAEASAVVFVSITSAERVVRVYGDAAVLTGRTTIAGCRDDQPFDGTYRYTHVFARRDGRWQAVSAHMSRLVE